MNNGYNGGQGNFYIAKWDGSTWSEMGTFNDVITALCFDPSGDLLVGGAFNTDASGNFFSGGPTYNALGNYYLAKWNGSTWSVVGDMHISKYYGNYVSSICTDHRGNIYAIGGFTDARGKYYVLKWDGSNWTELAAFNDVINAICTDASGNVYAGGNFKNAYGQWYVAKCN